MDGDYSFLPAASVAFGYPDKSTLKVDASISLGEITLSLK